MDESQGRSIGQPGYQQGGSDRRPGDASLWLAALVNSSDDAIISKTLDGVITSWNDAAQRIYGYSAEDVLGKSISLLIPEDRLGEYNEIMHRLRRGERIDHLETVRVRRNGSRIDVSVTISPIVDAHGQIVGASTIARDITARKQAEIERERLLADLGASRRQFQRIAELSPAGLSIYDFESGSITYVNARSEQVIGHTPDEVMALGQRFALTLWHPDDLPSLPEHRHKLSALADDEIYESEYQLRQPNGAYRWLHTRTSVFARADDGQVRQIVIAAQDITERKRTEAALRASEERFRSYFELGLIGMAITSPAKGILEVNDELCAILGYERSELIHMTWAEMTHPGDLAADATQFRRVVAGEIDGYSLDKRWIRKDGRVIDSTISVKCLRRADGTVEYFVALLQDITERKRAEEELLELKNRLAADLAVMTHLHLLGVQLLSTRDLQPLLQDTLDAGVGFLGADFGNIQLYNPQIGALQIIVHHGFDQNFLDYFSRVDDANAARGRAVGQGGRVVIEDVESDEGFAPHRAIAAATGFRAVQSTLLLDRGGALLGVFSTHFRQPHQFTKHELQLTDLYAQQAAEIIVFKQSEEQLRLAHTQLKAKVVERTTELAETNAALHVEMAERERAEGARRQLTMLVENSSDFIGLVSLDGRALFVNPAGQKLLGLSGDKQVRTTMLLDYIADSDRARFQHQILPLVFETGRWEGEVLFRHFVTGAPVSMWQHIFFVTEQNSQQRISLATISRDVTERRRGEEARQQLLERLVGAQEEERRRISHELHDSLGQHLTALHIGLKSAHDHDGCPPQVANRIDKLRELALTIDAEVDRLSFELRPPSLDDLGLQAALHLLVKEWSATSHIPVDEHIGQLDHRRLPATVETTVYRIVQETLTNILKHAGAARVSLIVKRQDGEVLAIVEDNGSGFDVEASTTVPGTGRQLGIAGMRERATLVGGRIDIETTPGSGTTVFVHIPLPPEEGGGGSAVDD